LIGLAIGDRSAAHTSSADRDETTSHLHPGRVVLLGVALIVAPATAAVSASGALISDRVFLLIVSTLIASIVLARFALAARDGESAHAEISYRATHDELTGLANRRAFLTAVDVASRDGHALAAVIYLDLDGFKEVNDCYGHHSGDDVLRSVARVLRAGVRSHDLIARLGGDEFAVLCPEVGSASDVAAMAERIREQIGREIRHEELEVSASVGIAVASVTRCSDLVGIADAAMYDAKRGGGDRVVLQSV
jgi:diguanylate cyclase (GGDEF)-like protein